MYLQGQKKSPISGKSLGLGFFSLRESFHFLVWLCSLGLRPRLHNCQTAKFIPWSDCVASASGLGYTTVRPRNENFLSRKRNLGLKLFHLWSTCFRPYRTFILWHTRSSLLIMAYFSPHLAKLWAEPECTHHYFLQNGNHGGKTTAKKSTCTRNETIRWHGNILQRAALLWATLQLTWYFLFLNSNGNSARTKQNKKY